MTRNHLPLAVTPDPHIRYQKDATPVLPRNGSVLPGAAMDNGHISERPHLDLLPMEGGADERPHSAIDAENSGCSGSRLATTRKVSTSEARCHAKTNVSSRSRPAIAEMLMSGQTPELSRAAKRRRLGRIVSPHVLLRSSRFVPEHPRQTRPDCFP